MPPCRRVLTTQGPAYMLGFGALCVLAIAAVAKSIAISRVTGPDHLRASSLKSTLLDLLWSNRLANALDRFPRLRAMSAVLAGCGALLVFRRSQARRTSSPTANTAGRNERSPNQREAELLQSDPGLLKKHSTFRTYSTSFATYPSIRTFYRPHPQADKLAKKPTPLPLLVFVHGLGGSLAQFHPLLTSLVNVGPCLGIDLPGCGLSRFWPRDWAPYSQAALADLLRVVIAEHVEAAQEVVLIAHSMGCSLSATLASSASPLHETIPFRVIGLVAICPRASVPSLQQVDTFKRLLSIPTPLFDLWRKWDRRGGIDSASVARFVGANADIETKKMQAKFNEQSQTAVWRRMAWGALPAPRNDGSMQDGLCGPEIWAGLSLPLFLVAGEGDNITKPEEVDIIRKALDGRTHNQGADEVILEDTVPQTAAPKVEKHKQENDPSVDSEERYGIEASVSKTTIIRSSSSTPRTDKGGRQDFGQGRTVLKVSILPKPATHTLLYDHATYRTLAGLIQSFLSDHVDSRLSLGWQLQHLATEGKWDVKNLAKWQAVQPVSQSIAGVFRAMKTLREMDESHSPVIFVNDWRDKIKAVIDISHESPVYDPEGLNRGGIRYHKFPTVSKIPPTTEEVKDFIDLVDRIRSEGPPNDQRSIGVHCHYGFNRTGFFICSYLVERERFSVQEAMDEFQTKRPPGIRHEHFIDTLFVRYHTGLKRMPTISSKGL